MRKFTQGRNASRFNDVIDAVAENRSRTVPDRRTAKTGHWIHRATCVEDAGSDNEITCTLPNYIESNGSLTQLTVVCDISGGTALNEAVPRLSTDDYLNIWNNAGTWRAVMTFQATEDCT